MNAFAALAFGAFLTSTIGYSVIAFWSAGIVTPVALLSLALTSVTYTMPASTSPSVTLVTTPPTFDSSLTGLTVTPAFLNTSWASTPQGTSGAHTTTLTAGFARSLTALMLWGLPLSTMISAWLRVKTCG